MPIPILRLPFLALKNVIECGEDVEILKLSLCSRKAGRAMKVCQRNQSIFNVESRGIDCFDNSEIFQLLLSEAESNPNLKEKLGGKKTTLDIVVSDVFELYLNLGEDIMFALNIDITSQMENHEGHKKYLSVDGISVPFIFTDDELYTFWNDKVQGLKFFVKYFEKNFRLGECNCEFRESVPELRRLVRYLNSLPKESVNVESVTIGNDAELSNAEYKYLLKTKTHELRAKMRPSEDFKFIGQFATKDLVLCSAHWFTLKHLLGCKCETLRVSGAKFSNKQLKEFIRKWSTGKLSHVKSVEVGLREDLDINIVLDIPGIRVTKQIRPSIAPRRMLASTTMTIYAKTGQRAKIDYVRSRMSRQIRFVKVE